MEAKTESAPKHPAATLILNVEAIKEGMIVNLLGPMLNITHTEVLAAINELLSLSKIKVYQDGANNMCCQLVKGELSLEGLDTEERAVYEVIGDSGNQGIWIRDIRNKTNLMMKPLNKVLKSLETKKKIKAVKSVLAGKKKVYMLFETEPDTKVTGDLFYSDQQEFDVEFTEMMMKTTLDYLGDKFREAQKNSQDMGPLIFRDNTFASTQEVQSRLQGLGLFTVKIGEREMLKVLRSLTMAGKVESCMKPSSDGGALKELFRINRPLTNLPSIARFPCGTCPIILQCSNSGAITPAKCIYLQEWLDMDLPSTAKQADI
ncbi:hypothetical protein B566_EDAN011273 [Ephemera danica]|nr:hypothetical protein B566_EDAN011273 [Ephemera danica]